MKFCFQFTNSEYLAQVFFKQCVKAILRGFGTLVNEAGERERGGDAPEGR